MDLWDHTAHTHAFLFRTFELLSYFEYGHLKKQSLSGDTFIRIVFQTVMAFAKSDKVRDFPPSLPELKIFFKMDWYLHYRAYPMERL